MPAAAIDHFGGPEVLTAYVLPVPKIDATEVLIALDTAGVGPWDADIRAGWYPGKKPRFPLVLGTDGAGVVAEVGSRVRRLKVGDKVYAYSWANPKGGFYAEYVAVASDKVAHIPARLDLEHAGAIATTGLTALQGIDDALKIKRGETIIIHGASGGVGTLAIQFAKLRGARVLATASGIDGLELVRDMGADVAVDARHEDVAEAARRFAPDGRRCNSRIGGRRRARTRPRNAATGRQACLSEWYRARAEETTWHKVHPYDGVAGIREFQKT